MDFGEVLGKTWRITWRNKWLWVLGILASCSASGRGNGGQFTSGFRGYNFERGEFSGFDWSLDISEGAAIAAVLGLLCAVFVLAVAAFILGIIGQGGLIAAFGREDDGVKLTLGEAFGLGVQNFWKLFGIRIVVFLAGLAVVIAFVLVTVFTLGLGLICLLPLLCLTIPLYFLVDGYITMTMVAAVEEQIGVLGAFGQAWRTLRSNLASFILMALILIIGGSIVGALMGVPFLAVGLPFLAGLIVDSEEAIASGAVASCLLVIVAIPIAAVIYGILNTFITGAWTLTYRRLSGKPGEKKPAAVAV